MNNEDDRSDFEPNEESEDENKEVAVDDHDDFDPEESDNEEIEPVDEMKVFNLHDNNIAHKSIIQFERDRPSVWNDFISLHAAPAEDIYKYDELKDALRNEYIDVIMPRLEAYEDDLREIIRENDVADANAPEHILIGTILCGAFSREHFNAYSHDYLVVRHRTPPHRKIFVNIAFLRAKPMANPAFVRGRIQYDLVGYDNNYYRKCKRIDAWEAFGVGNVSADGRGINKFNGFKCSAVFRTFHDSIWLAIISSTTFESHHNVLFAVNARFYNILKKGDFIKQVNDIAGTHAYVFGQQYDFAEYKFGGYVNSSSLNLQYIAICQANNFSHTDQCDIHQGPRLNDFKKNYVGRPTDKYPARVGAFDDPFITTLAQHQLSHRMLFFGVPLDARYISVYFHFDGASIDSLILDAGFFTF